MQPRRVRPPLRFDFGAAMSATPATATAPVYFDLRDRTLAEPARFE